WLPACLTPDEYQDGLAEITSEAELNSRTLDNFENALQLAVSIASTHEAAVRRFRSSQVHAHLHSLSSSTLKGKLDGDLEGRNLVGTPDEIREKISIYSDAGVDTFAGLLFAVDTVEETLDSMAMFAEEVMGQ
ncbi:MAG: LLM class flavin-dependent oxidoreductase, partial [Acidimicrobiales bacterium]|nr:LLM class flavin-dependent oxidoreductase [Acidimicrobiales bacterium]